MSKRVHLGDDAKAELRNAGKRYELEWEVSARSLRVSCAQHCLIGMQAVSRATPLRAQAFPFVIVYREFEKEAHVLVASVAIANLLVDIAYRCSILA